jgi:hypothetical protein
MCAQILRCYGYGYKGEYVDMLLDALKPQEQLETVLWLDANANYGTTIGDDIPIAKCQQLYVEARLLEATGRSGEALARFRELGKEDFFVDDLNTRVDLAIERLSGTTPVRLSEARMRERQ